MEVIQKQVYEEPSIKVVEMTMASHILNASGGSYPQWDQEGI